MALPESDRVRLVRLLGMLGSVHAGEVANAGALADQLVRRHGLTWEQVISANGQQERQQHASPPCRTWRDVIVECRARPDRLSAWEIRFLANIAVWRRALTPKQRAKLITIAEYLGVELPQ